MEDCCVCMETCIELLPCNHFIHTDCISNSYKLECPLCREPLDPKKYNCKKQNVIDDYFYTQEINLEDNFIIDDNSFRDYMSEEDSIISSLEETTLSKMDQTLIQSINECRKHLKNISNNNFIDSDIIEALAYLSDINCYFKDRYLKYIENDLITGDISCEDAELGRDILKRLRDGII